MADAQYLRLLVREYNQAQRIRIGLANRLGLKRDGSFQNVERELSSEQIQIFVDHKDESQDFEVKISKQIAKEVKKHPIYTEFLAGVKGCGPVLAAALIAEIDIAKAHTVSNLWSYAGFAPGKDKRRKGQKDPFNQHLRSKLFVLSGSFLKSSSPYRQFYDNMKTRLESKSWGQSPGHRHSASMRYMSKMFLRDLYVAWRTIEGLPVREPYESEYLGKEHHGEMIRTGAMLGREHPIDMSEPMIVGETPK